MRKAEMTQSDVQDTKIAESSKVTLVDYQGVTKEGC
jgi:hypothetical protein